MPNTMCRRQPSPGLSTCSSLTQHNAETIPLGIRTFISNYQQRYDQLMAAGVVATFPVMVAFFATQRWLVKGLTAGSVKG